jgi:hypothetical protein
MTIAAIDSLSQALFVSRVSAQAKTPSRSVAQHPSSETTIAPSRSKSLTRQALQNGEIANSIINGIASLINSAQKTNLPSNFPDQTRVTLQADITSLLKSLDTVVNSAEIGSVSLLRSDDRTLLLQTSELGGTIKAQGTALDAKALGISDINILSDLGLQDASTRINRAVYAVKERLDRLGNLDNAVNNRIDFGSLVNPSGNNTTMLSSPSSGYAPAVAYGGAVSGQYSANQFNRGSFVNLIG